MSTIVCQNIQSCLDTLTLKLNPPNNCYTTTHKPSTQTGWSCIESLSNGLDLRRENGDKLEVYVHPLVKRSASMLSDKSLEMCTENLGSETGSDITEDNDLFSMLTSLDSEGGEESSASRKPPQKKQKEEEKAKKVGYESLPPPLTTMCGAHTVRVRPHRESGRLVMTAVTTTSPRSSIYAERCNGRLTMSLLDDFSDDVAVAEAEVEEEEVSDEIEGGGEEEEYLEDLGEEVLEEGRYGNNKEVGEKIEIGEIQRLRSRCKGGRGSRRYINWETYWVAT